MRKIAIISWFIMWSCLVAGQSKIEPLLSHGTLGEVLESLEKQTGIIFSYINDYVDLEQEVNIGSGFLQDIISDLFPPQSFSLEYRANKVIIKPSKKTRSITGYVEDASTGEHLPGATILAVKVMSGSNDPPLGSATNAYGFFSLTLPAEKFRLQISFLGYDVVYLDLESQGDTVLHISLDQSDQHLKEVLVVGDRFTEGPESFVNSPEMGKVQLHVSEIQSLPTFMGEVDLIKSIQLLPGIQNTGEGSTNFYVRGGSADQNLILLDEAPVYNPSHLMGFFSVFNQDALQSVDFYKGNFSAKYGGRLSSVMDVRMREGNRYQWTASGGIGTTAARLTVEGPLVRDKSALVISARRTYADAFLNFSSDQYTRETSLYFYDLNAKFNYKLDNRNRIYFSGYFGRDLNRIRSLQYAIDWGNVTATFRWNHVFGNKLFTNMSLIASNYDYFIDLPQVDQPFDWRSQIRDYTLKYDFSHYLSPQLNLKYGIQSTLRKIRPGESLSRFENSVPRSTSLDHGLYFSATHQLSDRISLESGLRFSLFQLLGNGAVYRFNTEGDLIGEEHPGNGEIYKTYRGVEPRLNLRYKVNNNLSIKGGYARNYQYLNMLSNLSLGFNVFDIWIPSSKNIQPQLADQVALGLYFNHQNHELTYSIEGYYKWLDHQIGFRDHSSLIFNKYIEGELLEGRGKAYGVEFTARKLKGQLRGWLGYTWCRSLLKIDGLNNGNTYPSLQDQPHTINVSAAYHLNKRLTFSGNFIYSTGRPVTLPIESYWYEGRIVPIYGDKNARRLPDYHRLDLSVNLYKKKPNPKNESYWTFGIYNVYDRHNASSAFVSRELADLGVVNNSDRSAYQKLTIFGIIPSLTYNFKF